MLVFFYENGMPYIKYVGTGCFDNGLEVKVTIPKMDLCLSNITADSERTYEDMLSGVFDIHATYRMNMFTEKDDFFYIEPIVRRVSKEQLEKELGFKLKFIDNNEAISE